MAETIAAAPGGVQVHEPPPIRHAGKTERGDKFRQSLKSLEQLPPAEEKPPVETTPEPEKEPAKEAASEPAKEPAKTEAKKPASPLDALVKPTEEKKPEPDVATEFDEKTPNWKRAREVIKTQDTLNKQLKAEVERLKGLSAPPVDHKTVEERDALAKERDELRTKLQAQERDIKAIDGRYSDEYRSLEKERAAAVSKAVTRFESYAGAGKGDALKDALSLPIGRLRSTQIKEAMADLDPDDRARVLTLIENAEGAEDKIKDFEANLPDKWEEIQQRRDAQLREKQETSLKALETNYAKVAATLPETTITLREVDPSVPDADNWNTEIRTARDNAVSLLKPGADFNASASAVIKGLRYDSLEKRFLTLYAEHEEAMKRLAEFDAGEADFKGGRQKTRELPKKPSEKYHEVLARLNADVGEE